jgi:sulfite reductase alpha subunit-like flavoprotein
MIFGLDLFDGLFLIALGVFAIYYFREQLIGIVASSSSKKPDGGAGGKKADQMAVKKVIEATATRPATPTTTTNNVKKDELIQTRDIPSKMKNLGKKMIVFYGSQTGTAEDYSIRIVKEANQIGIPTILADLADYDMDSLQSISSENLVIFLVATYGEGEPTDNAQSFFEWINRDDLEVNLESLNYVIFGLGNKTYEHFNAAAKILDDRLKKFNSKAISVMGLGDDDGSLEEDFLMWKEVMWVDVCRFFGMEMMKFKAYVRR